MVDQVACMDHWQDIVDTQRHPIGDLDSYAVRCRSELQKNSILILERFLTKKALVELQREARSLHHKAFYCSQSHNVLLTEKNTQWEDDHPCNIEVISDKGCVPHDLIPPESYLRKIYTAEQFQRFIQSVLTVDKVHPYADRLSSINYNYYQEKQQLGWHFDNASFAITLMIQSSESGGGFQFVVNARNAEKNTVDIPLIKSVLLDQSPVEELQIKEGTLILFCGRNTLHRVSPVASQTPRILATLNYNLEKDIELSENARLTFFGRLQ